MEEKTYKLVKRSGGAAITLGIVTMTVGVVIGILSIVTGAKLLKGKSNILF